jgi:hypothetical protein
MFLYVPAGSRSAALAGCADGTMPYWASPKDCRACANLGFRRLRLRGITGARDEFLLAATVQNLRKLARFLPYRAPLPAGCPAKSKAVTTKPAKKLSLTISPFFLSLPNFLCGNHRRVLGASFSTVFKDFEPPTPRVGLKLTARDHVLKPRCHAHVIGVEYIKDFPPASVDLVDRMPQCKRSHKETDVIRPPYPAFFVFSTTQITRRSHVPRGA